MSDKEDIQHVVEDDEEESTVDVMKDYCEEDSSSSYSSKDIFEESSNDSCCFVDKPRRPKLSFDSHIKKIEGTSSNCYHCTGCKTYFSHINTARHHEFCISGKKPYKCKLCDKRYVKKVDRDNHHRTHTGEKPFSCSICDKTFYLKHKLSRHVRSHTGVKGDHECSQCLRTFLNKVALKKHLVSKHHANKINPCKVCKKVFEKAEERIKHKCIKRPVKKKLICEICGKTFSSRWNLTVHHRIHKGLRPFKCDACQQSFRLGQHLERHSAKHQTDADFECTLCKQTFGRKDNMIRHLKLNHPDRHLGVDLNEIVKRAEKMKKEKLNTTTVEKRRSKQEDKVGEINGVIIMPVDNLPNIRFAKMTGGHSSGSNSQEVTAVETKTVAGTIENSRTQPEVKSPTNSEPISKMKSSLSTVFETRMVKSVILTTVVQSEHLSSVVKRSVSIKRMEHSSVMRSVVDKSVGSINNSNLVRPCSSSGPPVGNILRSASVLQQSCVDYDRPKSGNCVLPATQESSSIIPISNTDRATNDPGKPINNAGVSNARYLPVSVLCFNSSNDLRTAMPKKSVPGGTNSNV